MVWYDSAIVTEAAPVARRHEMPSSRLFGNLTRGGPTSVTNPVRAEGETIAFALWYVQAVLFTANRLPPQQLRTRRFADWAHTEAAGGSSQFIFYIVPSLLIH